MNECRNGERWRTLNLYMNGWVKRGYSCMHVSLSMVIWSYCCWGCWQSLIWFLRYRNYSEKAASASSCEPENSWNNLNENWKGCFLLPRTGLRLGLGLLDTGQVWQELEWGRCLWSGTTATSTVIFQDFSKIVSGPFSPEHWLFFLFPSVIHHFVKCFSFDFDMFQQYKYLSMLLTLVCPLRPHDQKKVGHVRYGM